VPPIACDGGVSRGNVNATARWVCPFGTTPWPMSRNTSGVASCRFDSSSGPTSAVHPCTALTVASTYSTSTAASASSTTPTVVTSPANTASGARTVISGAVSNSPTPRTYTARWSSFLPRRGEVGAGDSRCLRSFS